MAIHFTVYYRSFGRVLSGIFNYVEVKESNGGELARRPSLPFLRRSSGSASYKLKHYRVIYPFPRRPGLRLLALSALTTIYVNFRSNDVRCRYQPGCESRKTLRNDRSTRLPSCYLGDFCNNKIARPTKPRKLFDVHDMLTYGIHYIGQIAHAQKSNQHGEVVMFYEGIITLVP